MLQVTARKVMIKSDLQHLFAECDYCAVDLDTGVLERPFSFPHPPSVALNYAAFSCIVFLEHPELSNSSEPCK